MLKPLVAAWEEEGRDVHGTALAWRQAEGFGEAKVKRERRRALDVFLQAVETGKTRLTERSVVVIDEVGLVGTRQLLSLLRLQGRDGFQVVAIGDPKQAQAVEAGPVINLMARALGRDGFAHVLTTLRQKGAEAETSLMFRNGRTREAIERKRKDGTLIVEAGDRQAAVDRVARLWRERVEANAHDPKYTVTVSAPTNAEARLISEAIRRERRAMGRLGREEVEIQATSKSRHSAGLGPESGEDFAMRVSVGDQVRLHDRVWATPLDGRSKMVIGSNGSVVAVEAITRHGLKLRAEDGRVGTVAWEKLRTKSDRYQMSPGDVLTIDGAQGSTVHEHILATVNGSQGVNSFKAYVAQSRHTLRTWIVTSDGAERQEIARRRPLGDQRPIGASDVIANVVRNFARQPEKSSALAFLDRARDVKRGAVRVTQHAHHVRQTAQRRGPPYHLRQKVQASAAVRRVAEVRVEVARRLQAVRNSAASVVRKVRKGLRP